VIVLGGYGRLGSLCVQEIAETTAARIVVGGRSVQRADRLALGYGDRAHGAYANASDGRTLGSVIAGASALVVCSGADMATALGVALEHRIPTVCAGATSLPERTLETLRERAWSAQVPLVLQAGAVPGLPGVCAEWLVRRVEEIDTLRIVSTGPWAGSGAALESIAASRNGSANLEYRDREWRRGRPRSTRFHFPEPVGTRSVRTARTSELTRFPDAHCVRSLLYLEPSEGRIARGLDRVLGLESEPRFALVAEAFAQENPETPIGRVALSAPDALRAAAAAIGILVRGLLARRIPAGVTTPREALNPSALLDGLQKRGVEVAS